MYYVIGGVHLFVCKITPLLEKVLMKLSGNVKNGTRNKWLNFGCDRDHLLDPRNFLNDFFHH